MDLIVKEMITQQVRFLYDVQRLRIASGQRALKLPEQRLSTRDQKYFKWLNETLDDMETKTTQMVGRNLKGIPIWDEWLSGVKGVGPRMGGLLVAETHIEKCDTISKLWAWYGLAVKDGKAQVRIKGAKANFNPWRKSKVLKILGESLIKQGDKYYELYCNYKNRKETQMVNPCMCCNGTGKAKRTEEHQDGNEVVTFDTDVVEYVKVKTETKLVTCWNCNGTGGPAPWGCSKMHRHNAAMRYMVKQFLADLWIAWRHLEGLPITQSYAQRFMPEMHPARTIKLASGTEITI